MLERTSKAESLMSWLDHWDAWLSQHAVLIGGLVLALGLLLRLEAAAGTFLNPDEAEHYLVADQPSLKLAYRASVNHPHPPLFILLLYYWRNLGSSEMMLRIPSIIAGTAFCWLLFKWLSNTFNRTVGLIALILAAFLPPLVELSAQVRAYSLLLMLVGAVFFLLDHALAENKVRLMALSFISLYLAILSNYSAFLVAAAGGGYALSCFINRRTPLRLKVAWLLGQAGVVALLGVLYKSHISRLRGSGMERRAVEGWLANSYFNPTTQHLPSFLFRQTVGVFQFVFGDPTIGNTALIMFALSVVFFLLAKIKMASQCGPREFGILLILPFVLGLVSAIAGFYPYGPTRHSVFLAVFMIAGVSAFLTKAVSYRTGPGMAVAVLMVAISQGFGQSQEPGMTRSDQSKQQLHRALQFAEGQISPADLIFIDNQSSILLRYYLCRDEAVSFDKSVPGFVRFKCRNNRIVAGDAVTGDFQSDSFSGKCQEMARNFGLDPTDRILVIQVGWGAKRTKLGTELQRVEEFKDLEVHKFGNNIQIIRLGVAGTGKCQPIKSDQQLKPPPT